MAWWHQVAYYSQKMILSKTQYKTHDGKFYYWSLQNMAAVSKKLQAESSCPYSLQQSLPFHGHKKPEFSSPSVGPRTFSLLFSDILLLREIKQSSQCFISLFLARQWRKNQLLSWKHLNVLLFAGFTDKSFNFSASRHDFKPFGLASCSTLQNLYFDISPAFLDHPPNQAR